MPEANALTPPFDAGPQFDGVIGFDFATWLPAGVSVVTANIICEQYAGDGVDTAPMSRLLSTPTIVASQANPGNPTRTQVNQLIGNLVDKVVYRFTCECTFSDGIQREAIWTHLPALAPD